VANYSSQLVKEEKVVGLKMGLQQSHSEQNSVMQESPTQEEIPGAIEFAN